MKLKVTKREFVDSNGNSWEWEESEEARKAILALHGASQATVTPPLTRPN